MIYGSARKVAWCTCWWSGKQLTTFSSCWVIVQKPGLLLPGSSSNTKAMQKGKKSNSTSMKWSFQSLFYSWWFHYNLLQMWQVKRVISNLDASLCKERKENELCDGHQAVTERWTGCRGYQEWGVGGGGGRERDSTSGRMTRERHRARHAASTAHHAHHAHGHGHGGHGGHFGSLW